MTGRGRRGRRWRRLDFERVLEPEDSENDVVTQYIEVPRDDGALVCDLDDALVNLAFGHLKNDENKSSVTDK